MCSWEKSTRRGRWIPKKAGTKPKSAETETLLIGHRQGARYYGERRILLKNLGGVDPGAGGEVRSAEGERLGVQKVCACATEQVLRDALAEANEWHPQRT
jgi:hypothetical protein